MGLQFGLRRPIGSKGDVRDLGFLKGPRIEPRAAPRHVEPRGQPLFRSTRLVPSPSDVVFALVMLLILIGGRHALFNDPGTLWHLQLGRDILAAGTVPQMDTLT